MIGADRHERTEERLGYRNGYRPRSLTTQVGDIELQIPKLRAGSFLPSILEPRRRVDQALYAVIMEAYIGGVSTRKVDALVAALGSQSGISKSQVSRICQDIDHQVQAFLGRPLESSSYAYVYLDATYLKGRLGKAQQVCSEKFRGHRRPVPEPARQGAGALHRREDDARRRNLPHRRLDHPPGGGGAAGAARALAAGGPSHVLRREHGDHPGARRHQPAGPQRLREAGRRPQGIEAAAPHRAQRP